DVCIYHDNIVRHTAVIPLGGSIINKDIRSYGILERQIERLKIKFGGAVGKMERADKFITIPGLNARDPKEISCRNLASIIEARLLDIVESVLHEIKRAGYEGRLGAGIVLTGGTAQTRNIDILFKNHTGYDVRVAIPDTYVTDSSLEMINSPAYSMAVGLLLKATGVGSTAAVSRRPMVRTATVTAVKPPVQAPAPPVPEKKEPEVAVEDTRSSRRRWNELAEKRQNTPKDTPFTPEEPENKPDKESDDKPKNGWWQRVKERMTGAFDVVDDEI
ncbi:rod shape-determining protein, partial [Alistipes sp. OttesenSCG-928-L06]|nr:rod shape-determining protein [Alistipes sp. OttesenSCG-928-L06]